MPPLLRTGEVFEYQYLLKDFDGKSVLRSSACFPWLGLDVGLFRRHRRVLCLHFAHADDCGVGTGGLFYSSISAGSAGGGAGFSGACVPWPSVCTGNHRNITDFGSWSEPPPDVCDNVALTSLFGCLFFLIVRVALKFRSLRMNAPRLCRLAVF